MIYQSNTLKVDWLENGIAELIFDSQGESVNKFDQQTVADLSAALDALEALDGVKGLLISSAKSVFIAGADITEFGGMFGAGLDSIKEWNRHNNVNFNRLESLPFPTTVAINGFALGGGFELCLACDFRVMSTAARVGLPETKLGIIPGWGGTVRLPRVIGIDEALTWIATAKNQRPEVAMKVGAVDAAVAPDQLRDAALATLQRAIDGKLEYQSRRDSKRSALQLNDNEATMAFAAIKGMVGQQAGRNYPAPVAAVLAVEKARSMGLEEALNVEVEAFAELAQGTVAPALVGVFMADQLLATKAKDWAKKADNKVSKAAVLGAGIMGGGVAYQSAVTGTPIKMKDIAQEGIDLGLREASKLLTKTVSRGRMSPKQMAQVLNSIDPCLTYEGFDTVDIVIEAVVENPMVKLAVLADVEKHVREDAVLTSNTSTISINYLAKALQRPENFCGMHFFNPVHAMPLVEIIRGEKSSDNAIAMTVAYASAMGKKPVVVEDCPGFLVNRVLFPYFDGFAKLLRDGADFQAVDKVMERWGWPMGPAFLVDVVGADTAVHGAEVMAEGFPDRMVPGFTTAPQIMLEADRLGQKNGKGFYDYGTDKRGRPTKTASDVAYQLMESHVDDRTEFSDEEIIARMMVPMATEMARCLEEGIVGTPAEADLALLYGIGFPAFRGGVMRWLDTIGLEQFVAMAKQNSDLGKMYEPTEGMLAKLANNETYYG